MVFPLCLTVGGAITNQYFRNTDHKDPQLHTKTDGVVDDIKLLKDDNNFIKNQLNSRFTQLDKEMLALVKIVTKVEEGVDELLGEKVMGSLSRQLMQSLSNKPCLQKKD